MHHHTIVPLAHLPNGFFMQTLSPLCHSPLLLFPVHLFQWRLLKTLKGVEESGPSLPAPSSGRVFAWRTCRNYQRWNRKEAPSLLKVGDLYMAAEMPSTGNPFRYFKYFTKRVNSMHGTRAYTESGLGRSLISGRSYRKFVGSKNVRLVEEEHPSQSRRGFLFPLWRRALQRHVASIRGVLPGCLIFFRPISVCSEFTRCCLPKPCMLQTFGFIHVFSSLRWCLTQAKPVAFGRLSVWIGSSNVSFVPSLQ